MLVTPPFGASSNIALWRAYNKPPVELVVADFRNGSIFWSRITRRKLMTGFVSIMNPMG